MAETEAFEAFHQTRFPVSGASGTGTTYIQAGEQLKELLRLYYLAACAWQREQNAQWVEAHTQDCVHCGDCPGDLAAALRRGTP